MSSRSKLIIFLALLIVSVGTLIQAVVSEGDNQLVYGTVTTVSHLALLATGYAYANGRHEQRRKLVDQIKMDVLGR